MDPLTLATLIQMIALFFQERRAGEAQAKEEFLDWLSRHRHDELREQIANNHHLATELNALLRQDHAQIISLVEGVSQTTNAILQQVSEFRAFVDAATARQELSPQALAVVRFFYASDAQDMVLAPGRTSRILQAGSQGLQVGEPEFLNDDLESLLQLGYLRLKPGASVRLYQKTRAGAVLAQGLPPPDFATSDS